MNYLNKLSFHKIVFFALVLFSAFTTLSVSAANYRVEPIVEEWRNRICPLNFVSHYRALCQAAGGIYRGVFASPTCEGPDYDAFSLLSVSTMLQTYGNQLCNVQTVPFSGWGQPTGDQYCGGGTGPKYTLGVYSGDTGNATINCAGGVEIPRGMTRNREVNCPEGAISINNGCYFSCAADEIFLNNQCVVAPTKDDGCDATLSDNPCNIATGNKFRSESDFLTNGLGLIRAYNSRTLSDIGLGIGWRHSFQKAISVATDSLVVISNHGRGEIWTKTGNLWVGDLDSDVSIFETASGFELIRENGAREVYNLFGVIQLEIDTSGYQTIYSYDSNGSLSQVSNHYGQSITFAYLNSRLQEVTDSSSALYKYEYDTNDNLVSVIYPDETSSDDNDNPRKIYHYENSSFPNHLTGITDETGNRYATFAYDASGKAIQSELGATTNPVGQEKITLDYQGAN